MKPPICAFCRKDMRRSHDGKFDLITFQPTEADKEYNQRLKDNRMVGHPGGVAWFCPTHAPAAHKLTHLTLGEALKHMRKNQSLVKKIQTWIQIIKN